MKATCVNRPYPLISTNPDLHLRQSRYFILDQNPNAWYTIDHSPTGDSLSFLLVSLRARLRVLSASVFHTPLETSPCPLSKPKIRIQHLSLTNTTHHTYNRFPSFRPSRIRQPLSACKKKPPAASAHHHPPPLARNAVPRVCCRLAWPEKNPSPSNTTPRDAIAKKNIAGVSP